MYGFLWYVGCSLMLRKCADKILASRVREVIVAIIGILVEEKGSHEH